MEPDEILEAELIASLEIEKKMLASNQARIRGDHALSLAELHEALEKSASRRYSISTDKEDLDSRRRRDSNA